MARIFLLFKRTMETFYSTPYYFICNAYCYSISPKIRMLYDIGDERNFRIHSRKILTVIFVESIFPLSNHHWKIANQKEKKFSS